MADNFTRSPQYHAWSREARERTALSRARRENDYIFWNNRRRGRKFQKTTSDNTKWRVISRQFSSTENISAEALSRLKWSRAVWKWWKAIKYNDELKSSNKTANSSRHHDIREMHDMKLYNIWNDIADKYHLRRIARGQWQSNLPRHATKWHDECIYSRNFCAGKEDGVKLIGNERIDSDAAPEMHHDFNSAKAKNWSEKPMMRMSLISKPILRYNEVKSAIIEAGRLKTMKTKAQYCGLSKIFISWMRHAQLKKTRRCWCGEGDISMSSNVEKRRWYYDRMLL